VSGLCDMTDAELREAIAALVQEYGDVPPDSIKPERIDLSDWRFLCADGDLRKLVASGHIEHSAAGWSSCTIKSFVHVDGQGD